MTTRNRLSALVTTAALAASGGLLTATPAAAAVTCASPVWKAEYYANTTLTGTPRLTTCDNVIAENYGTGDPAGVTLPRDNFSVRWSVTRDFGSGGPFTFTAEAQDGIRVHLDGVRRIDLWKNVSTTQKKTVAVTVPAGRHTIHVSYATWTGAANVKFGYAPNTSASVDKVRPLAPAGATVAYDRSLNKATLKWAANKEMDHAGYRVYRRPSTSAAWTRAGGTALVTGTAYGENPPATGQRFLYELRAVDKAGNESPGSADLTVATVDRTPPVAPHVMLDACPDNLPYAAPQLVTTAANSADIAWYEAQRHNPVTGAWTTVHSGARGSFCDTGQPADGSSATYRGRARDAAGNWSPYSPATSLTTADLTPPAPVTDVRVDHRSGVPHLTWSPVAGAASYQVVQYDPATGGHLNALPTGDTTTATDVVPRQTAAVADTYRYAVRAVDAKGNAAAPVETTLSMADRAESIPPFRTTANRFDEGVMIWWLAADPWTVDENPLPAYRIVRTDTATGETSTVDGCKPFTSDDRPLTGPDVSWTWADDTAPSYAGRKMIDGRCWDVQGKSRTTYEYRIVTIDRYGHASQPGPAATETTPDTERPAPVLDLAAERIPFGVRLTWTPPADDDVEGYAVWQGTTDPATGETSWERNCWWGDSMPRTEILCPTVPDGREHVYRVAAMDSWDPDPRLDDLNPAEITVALPDTRPPGWTGTGIRQSTYPGIYLGCADGSSVPCGTATRYRVERWDPSAGAYTTLSTGAVGSTPVYYSDPAVGDDLLSLHYYRVVFTDPSGAEQSVRSEAYGIWASWL
ncbi:PA14 domain-containing protein [Streptomyces flavochromogenes]|uniref:PA14 domain-containing protein n=1 Tax=Streptomyces flavochromogenes TaxID=68199 RepID=A0ABW6XP93_9ACTN|nr:PA14 domain-containing protein [Streptomyces flavochromogenes]